MPKATKADTYTSRLLTEGSFAFPHEGRNLDGTALHVAGLTKREYFAIHFLTGIGAWFPAVDYPREVGKPPEAVTDATEPLACQARAALAVAQADALLAALDFPKPSHPSRF